MNRQIERFECNPQYMGEKETDTVTNSSKQGVTVFRSRQVFPRRWRCERARVVPAHSRSVQYVQDREVSVGCGRVMLFGLAKSLELTIVDSFRFTQRSVVAVVEKNPV